MTYMTVKNGKDAKLLLKLRFATTMEKKVDDEILSCIVLCHQYCPHENTPVVFLLPSLTTTQTCISLKMSVFYPAILSWINRLTKFVLRQTTFMTCSTKIPISETVILNSMLINHCTELCWSTASLGSLYLYPIAHNGDDMINSKIICMLLLFHL